MLSFEKTMIAVLALAGASGALASAYNEPWVLRTFFLSMIGVSALFMYQIRQDILAGHVKSLFSKNPIRRLSSPGLFWTLIALSTGLNITLAGVMIVLLFQ